MFDSKTSVATLSVASNLSLTLIKLVVGLTIGSISVIAEAIHSGVDLLAAVIALFAVRQSARPPDDKFPFGRGKVENVSGTVEALLIFLAAGVIVWEAVKKMTLGSDLPSVDLGIGAMAISVVANTFVSRQLLKVARRTESVALEADAYHLTTDIMTSAGVFVGLIAVYLTGWRILDPIAALGVAALIVKAAWDITRRSFVDLLDRSLPEQERRALVDVLDKHGDRFVGYHQIRTRKSGPERYVDLHLVVHADIPVVEAHALCDHLERDIVERLPRATVNIHVEPCSGDCSTCQQVCSHLSTFEAGDPDERSSAVG